MSTATLSSKFQITIPSTARAALKLEAGRKLEVIIREDRLELVPVAPMSTFRGFLRDKMPHSAVERDEDRAL